MKKELIKHNEKTIYEYTIENDYLKATFINIGAIITSLVDKKTGINVIVGHDKLETYLDSNPGYMNSIVGRNAGRIKDSRIVIDGMVIDLTKNFMKKHQLHGGFNGFNKKYFEGQLYKDAVVFSAASVDLEDGFPGDVILTVTYRLIDNELHLLYDAVSDKKTILNFTNHAYFNLNRTLERGILDHTLFLNAKEYLELDEEMIPVKKSKVENTPFDFTVPKTIGKDIMQSNEQLRIGTGYDHPFVVNKENDINHIATLTGDKSELRLEIYSDQAAVILYTGNFLNKNDVLTNNTIGFKQAALCLETQGIPNSAHFDEFKFDNIYDKGQRYSQHTIWKIS